MRNRVLENFLIWSSLGLIFLAVIMIGWQLVSYSRLRASFPQGLTIAGVPVGGLSQSEAANRLVQSYGIPVELYYGDAVIQIKPQVVGFDLNIDEMMAAADLQRITQPFWSAFWDYLWNNLPEPRAVPLSATFSEERLRQYLVDEISPRYDKPAAASIPVPGTTDFQAGDPGSVLNVDRAVTLITDALSSPTARFVNLTTEEVAPDRPSLNTLEILLRQILDVSQFDGVTEIYLKDLQTQQELSFARELGEDVPQNISFTAASTMKIPIMVSVYRRVPDPAPDAITQSVELMIERSENDPADQLMKQVLDTNLGPMEVTDDLQYLGLENTFLAGYFYPGAPLLYRYKTPANQRTDISTDPDEYNQTTPLDMGLLLDDLYQCSLNGRGTFAAAFPGQISQTECLKMIDYLSQNEIAVLIKSGLPEGTRLAHKHGWIVENDGLLHTMGDAGIVYTPGGNYILVIFMHQPTQLIFDPANKIFADLSRAVYNYFNLQ